MCPGVCFINDRGPEFCNQVVDALTDSFGTETRITIRPQSNGQAEKMVNTMKTRMKTEMLSNRKIRQNILPCKWGLSGVISS